MIHFVLHDAKDTVAVGGRGRPGMTLTGWILDDDKMISIQACQDIPIGHKVALKGHGARRYGDQVRNCTSAR